MSDLLVWLLVTSCGVLLFWVGHLIDENRRLSADVSELNRLLVMEKLKNAKHFLKEVIDHGRD